MATENTLAARIVRYADLVPCRDAFIDTRSPGSDAKENFTIIGPGVSENPGQHIHIAEPHGFNIGGARQPPGCLNSQHSHQTAEVFYVHSGQWRFMTGEAGRDGAVEMGPGDLISIPTNLFRGFENIGDAPGFLWAVLGGDDPGHVLWAPYVFDMARDYGLVLLADGQLIDTVRGDAVPPGAQVMPRTSPADVAALDVADSAALAKYVVRRGEPRPAGPLGIGADGGERQLVGAAPLDWPHGFTVTETVLAPGTAIAPHQLAGSDVWFVHAGAVSIRIGDDTAQLGPGDTVTCPSGAWRALANAGPTPAIVVQVRSGDAPPVPVWQ